MGIFRCVLIKFGQRKAEIEGRDIVFCRDKGRGRVDEGALCLSGAGWSGQVRDGTPAEARCHQDKHKASTLPHIRPLSLQDGGIRFVS